MNVSTDGTYCIYFTCVVCKPSKSMTFVRIRKNNIKTYLILRLSAFRSSSSCDSLSVLSFLSSSFWILPKKKNSKRCNKTLSIKKKQHETTVKFLHPRQECRNFPHSILKMKAWTTAAACNDHDAFGTMRNTIINILKIITQLAIFLFTEINCSPSCNLPKSQLAFIMTTGPLLSSTSALASSHLFATTKATKNS